MLPTSNRPGAAARPGAQVGSRDGDADRGRPRPRGANRRTDPSSRETPRRLVKEDIEAIAQRVAELLSQASAPSNDYLDAAGVAKRFGVSRDWVYGHKHELGGIPKGECSRTRWLFDADCVRQALKARAGVRPEPPPPAQARAARQRARGRVRLLPVGEDG
jgi:hypothetical protein